MCGSVVFSPARLMFVGRLRLALTGVVCEAIDAKRPSEGNDTRVNWYVEQHTGRSLEKSGPE